MSDVVDADQAAERPGHGAFARRSAARPGHPVAGPDTPTTVVSDLLRARTLFKFIIGIGNSDWEHIRFLTQVYTLAGADIIDVASRPDVVAATRDAMAEARTRSAELPAASRIMVSLALPDDPHVRKGGIHPEHRGFIVPVDTFDLSATAYACLDEGAEMVELHASDSDDRELEAAVRALSTVLQGRYLSVCLGTEGLRAPRDVIRQAAMVRAIHGPCTMIQAEGITLVKDDTPASSVQGLALAQALLAKTGAYIVVAGGANRWTRGLTDVLGVPVHGIASGSYARGLVERFMAGQTRRADVPAAAQIARRFARRAKGVPEHAL